MDKTLKEIRKQAKLTQAEAAELLDVSLRSYKSYENDPEKEDTLKYRYMLREISEKYKVDEDHGILSLNDIREKCSNVFLKYNLEFCYLFGSYAKGTANEKSDVDLLVSGNVKGLKYFGLVEDLRISLNKKIDAIDINQLENNFQLTKEILKDGVKIYG